MNRFNVEIKECISGGKKWVSTHTSESEGSAVSAAVRRHFGRGRFVIPNSELNRGTTRIFGQIGHRIDRSSQLVSTDTGNIYIDVTAV